MTQKQSKLAELIEQELPTVIPEDNPPDRRLALEPTIKSEADLDVALAEAGYLESRQQTIEAQANAICQLVRFAFQERGKTKVGRSQVSIADRLQALQAEIDRYCDENRAALLANEKGKTRKFTHGSICWKTRPATLAFYSGHNAASVAKSLDEEFGLAEKVRDLLNQLALFDDAAADEFIDVAVTLAMPRIRERFKQKQLTSEHRKRLKLKVEGGDDQFSCSPARPVVKDESEKS